MNKLDDDALKDVSGGYNDVEWYYANGPYTGGKSGTKYMIKWDANETVYGVLEFYTPLPSATFGNWLSARQWIRDH